MSYRKFIKIAYDNVAKYGITDVELFNNFFELKLLGRQEVKQEIIDYIDSFLTKNSTGKYSFSKLNVKKIGHVLLPKKEFFDFRKCALIDIVDEILYLSIVLVMANQIEKSRIKKGKKVVFSYRYKPTKQLLFDTNYNFTSFRSHVSKLSKRKDYKVMVTTDISNFYDRLNLHRLESNLLAIENIDKELVHLLNELLLFWSNRDSYGLPVGSNASRILAEVVLIEVDDYLLSQGVKFVRFVDDYRIYAKEAYTAQRHLSLLVNKLNDVGLFLNTKKTSVKSIEDQVAIKSDKEPVKVVSPPDKDQFGNPVIIRGYSGLIPTKFRKMTEKEKRKFADYDFENNIKNMNDEPLVKPVQIIELTKAIVSQSQYSHFIDLTKVLKKFPQFLPYVTDVLIKFEDSLSDSLVEDISKELISWMDTESHLEYTQIYLSRLFSSGRFSNKDMMYKAFLKLNRSSGAYVGRAFLDSFYSNLSRVEVIELKKYYQRADLWERRQILRIINISLSKGEKRAFFKDVKINSNDLLSKYICEEKYLRFIK